MTELPKNFNPAETEQEIAKVWDAERCFHADPLSPGEPYSVVIPPPNVTAALHLGHALNNTIQDILVRRARMQGKNAVWLPGTDHAGIATQTVVERRVLREEKKRRTDFKREEFVAKIQAWKDEYEKVILGQLKAMGCSCDFERTAFTMDPPRTKAVREAFFRLFKDGLIYRGKRLVNWDPVTLTALADDEVENEEVDGFFYYLRYPLCDADGKELDGQTITVATTRPETMLGDTAVAINPTDPRAESLKGLYVKLPIVHRIIPIVLDDYVVKPVEHGGDPADTKAQMATGFLKVTPAHDPNDWEIGRRHDLAVINVFAPDASISLAHGWSDLEPYVAEIPELKPLLGSTREAAREAVVAWFKAHDLLEAQKPYRHAVGHSYRSHVPVEPYLSDQWYLKVTDSRLAGAALGAMDPAQRAENLASQGVAGDAANQDSVTFYPPRYAKTFQLWHENIRDWCISRQLWWGHRIPVWRFTDNDAIDSKPDDVLHTLIEQVIRLNRDGRIAMKHTGMDDDAKSIDLQHSFICIREDDDKPAIELMRQLGFTQDEDVLDTWFSSALWPMSTLGWPDAAKPQAGKIHVDPLTVWNPTSVLCTAREIITLWVSRMVMFNEYFLGHVPFKDVFIHAMIQDGHGQKMSKSLGNGVDPLDIIATHGSDALRFTLCNMTTQTQDVRLPVDCVDPFTGEAFTPEFFTNAAGYVVAKPVQTRNGKKIVSTYGAISGEAKPTADMPAAANTSSKFDYGKGFANKLWSLARFVFAALENTPLPARGFAEESSLADRWILSRLTATIADASAALDTYRFDQYARAVYAFVETDFSSWYVEFAKPQLRDAAKKPQTAVVLAAVIDATLRLLHPVMPFVTEKLWDRLNELRPDRSIAGVLELPPSARAISAAWPVAGAGDVVPTFSRLQELVTAVRNLRGEQKVEPRRVITIAARGSGETTDALRALQPAFEALTASKLSFAETAGTPTLTVSGVELFVSDLVDAAADKERSTKRKDELTKKKSAMEGRLANEGYVAKAPPHLIKQTRDELAAIVAELEKL